MGGSEWVSILFLECPMFTVFKIAKYLRGMRC